MREGTARGGRAALAGVTVRNGRTATRSCRFPRGHCPLDPRNRGCLPRTPGKYPPLVSVLAPWPVEPE